MQTFRVAVIFVLGGFLGLQGTASESAALRAANVASDSVAEGPADLRAPLPASNSEWRLIGGGSFEQHFSPLRQVNESTVKQLKLAWFADMPTVDGLTGIPLVADGVVYQSGALGKVWANDVRTGKLLWSYDAQIKFPMGLVPSWGSRLSRGLALWQDKVLRATGDCRLMALDRRTGAQLWEVHACDPADYKTITGAPRVGGGKAWEGITYDPATNLVYIGTDGVVPSDPKARGAGSGDELFTCAIVAVN